MLRGGTTGLEKEKKGDRKASSVEVNQSLHLVGGERERERGVDKETLSGLCILMLATVNARDGICPVAVNADD